MAENHHAIFHEYLKLLSRDMNIISLSFQSKWIDTSCGFYFGVRLLTIISSGLVVVGGVGGGHPKFGCPKQGMFLTS